MGNAAPAVETTIEALGVTMEALGTLARGRGEITWLRVGPSARGVTTIHMRGDLAVEETGTVAFLRVKNPTRERVLVPSDLVLEGGKQTRAVERSVIVPAGAVVDIPVRCVEQKRWHARGAGDAGTRFETAGTLSHVTRTSFMQMKERSLASGRAYALDQGQVWSEVKDELTRSGVQSSTESYAVLLHAARAARAVRAQATRDASGAPDARAIASVDVPADANGVLVTAPDRAAWIEVFPSRDDLAAQATAIVAELDDAREDAAHAGATHEHASTKRDAKDILAALATSKLFAIDRPEGTAGEPYAMRGEGTAGAALFEGSAIVHLAVAVA